MLKKITLLFLLITSIFSCEKTLKDADIIVSKSIDVSGGEFIKNSNIEFDFRDMHYRALRKNGKFQFERRFTEETSKHVDSIAQITDNLSNKGFTRLVNSFPITIHDSMAVKYSASVNSVHYFSVLPYGLDGKAVNKTYEGTSKLKGKEYFKIKVTFNEDGGGEDFEDVFMYWINTKTFKVEYLAYSYNEDDGLGLRFREAYNERYIQGIRFVDYNNYKPKTNDIRLEKLDILFEQDELELLSKIELENVLVTK